MSEEIKIHSEGASNATNIQLSESTKALLLCRAQLSDIFNTVGDVVYSRYMTDLPDSFGDAHMNLDKELMDIINTFIEVTSLQSDYKEM